jgi:hypothetical protein
MKRAIQIVLIILVLTTPVLLTAQPMPFDQSIGGGAGSAPAGGGAPIGGGLFILLTLALGYGSRKAYKVRKRILI